MKKALLLAMFSLFFTMLWTEPAQAASTITVFNDTDTGVAIQIGYLTQLCRDDHVNVAPHGRFASKVGLCRTKSFDAQITNLQGHIIGCSKAGLHLNRPAFRIRGRRAAGYCSVVSVP
jgi:hypothetical protein